MGDPYWNVKTMKFDVREDNIKKVLTELKAGKAGELDGLKPELYKMLKESRVVVRSLKEGMEKMLEDGEEPERWKESRTVMIPKKRRPTVTDLRPIELADVSYV